MTANELTLSVIIVTYNSNDCIVECLDSLRDNELIDIKEVFVVDNASTDGTQHTLEKLSTKWPALKCIYNSENMGLALANNQPMLSCSARYILILNPDTVVRKGAIAELVTYLDQHRDVGVVGPKQFFADGSPHVTYHRSWSILSPILWRFLPYGLVRFCYDQVFGRYEEQDVLFVSGACLMIPRNLFWAIGGYDENYFLAVEDAVDLCMRVKKEGYRIVFYPGAEVVHIGGLSGVQVKPLALSKGCEGNLYHLRKHNSAALASFLRILLIINFSIKAIIMGPLCLLGLRRFCAYFHAYVYTTGKLLAEKPPKIRKNGHGSTSGT
ncbi:MAG: glycosyltransferase family 2 protein [Thermoleophilia bacterium]